MSGLRHKIVRIARGARRLRGNTHADRSLLDAVEEAALSSCTIYAALTSLRARLNKLYMESDGRLFEFMLLWYLGGIVLSGQSAPVDALVGVSAREDLAKVRLKSFKEQVDEVLGGSSSLLQPANKILHSNFFITPQGEAKTNSYQRLVACCRAKLQEKFPTILRELALLEEPFTFPESPLKFNQVKLFDPMQADLLDLASALKDERKLSLLCTPKSLLTHLENFQLALLHARLWLLRSELPVCFGHHVTYNELRSQDSSFESTFQCMLYETTREVFPSITETDLMQKTVKAHSRLKDNQEVYHMRVEDFLETSGWYTPGSPAVINQGKKKTSVDYLATQPGIEDEEDVGQTVRVFELQETSRVLAQLQKINAKSFAKYSQF